MDFWTEIIGNAAAVLTTVAYIPQAVKVLKTRDTRSISLGMYAAMTGGIGCWAVYGVLIGSQPIIVANGITFVLAAMILAMKVKYG